MPITINGSGTVTGISAGGFPDDCITTAELAANAVTTAKLGTNEASGLAKAWVNFNGTGTVAIRASGNVSSITDNGTGLYTVNFTTAITDANYAFTALAGGASDSSTASYVTLQLGISPTTSALAIRTHTNNNATIDATFVGVAIYR